MPLQKRKNDKLNSDPDLLAQDLTRTLLLVRKVAKVSQIELGEILELHQSAISRIETGDQLLTPRQLIRIANYFDLNFDDLMHGSIDYWRLAERFKTKPPFHQRFMHHPHAKLRELLPLMKLIKEEQGLEAFEEVLENFELRECFLRNPDMNVGSQFVFDFYAEALKRKWMSVGRSHHLAELSFSKEIQGFLSNIYFVAEDANALLRARVMNAKHYESNFEYVIEKQSSERTEISISPAKHMSQIEYKHSQVGDVICSGRKEHFKLLPLQIGKPELQVEEVECHFHGGSKCLYHIVA
jgi:transcriptional regulator with XRE-family HTH domain